MLPLLLGVLGMDQLLAMLVLVQPIQLDVLIKLIVLLIVTIGMVLVVKLLPVLTIVLNVMPMEFVLMLDQLVSGTELVVFLKIVVTHLHNVITKAIVLVTHISGMEQLVKILLVLILVMNVPVNCNVMMKEQIVIMIFSLLVVLIRTVQTLLATVIMKPIVQPTYFSGMEQAVMRLCVQTLVMSVLMMENVVWLE